MVVHEAVLLRVRGVFGHLVQGLWFYADAPKLLLRRRAPGTDALQEHTHAATLMSRWSVRDRAAGLLYVTTAYNQNTTVLQQQQQKLERKVVGKKRQKNPISQMAPVVEYSNIFW